MLETLERRSERPRRRRRVGLIVLLCVLILLLGLVVAGGVYYQWATGASGPKTAVTIDIPSGATGSDVAAILKKDGVIRSTLAFRVLSRFRGFRSGFQAGQYKLTTNMTISAVLAALKQGPFVDTLRVTFPEGFRISQMAQRVHEGLGIKASAFTKAATSGAYSLGDYLPKGTKTVEGFLFPSTYDFLKDATADDVIQRMLTEFEKETAVLPWSNAKAHGVTDYQVVVMASLIEREARFQEDRAKIAAVIYNRLKKGMPLEIDASIQYIKGTWDPITVQDRSLESPYNTYLNTGLPPAPIASPGLASIEAALTPVKAAYLYYVVIDDAGHHCFTDTYEKFLTAKNQHRC
jgi:UPF0755 protein